MAKRKADPVEQKAAKRRKNRNTNDNASKASLLGIPGELRNTIYTLVLVETEPIRIDRVRRQQPDLLQTCNQIRGEASGIYHHQNHFELHIRNLHMPPPTHWVITHTPEASIVYRDRPKWKNFLRWCKYYHSTGGEYLHIDKWIQYGQRRQKEKQTAKLVFDMVTEMKNVSWQVVGKVVSLHRKGLDAKQGVWSWK